jgi:hypothetical protein
MFISYYPGIITIADFSKLTRNGYTRLSVNPGKVDIATAKENFSIRGGSIGMTLILAKL